MHVFVLELFPGKFMWALGDGCPILMQNCRLLPEICRSHCLLRAQRAFQTKEELVTSALTRQSWLFCLCLTGGYLLDSPELAAARAFDTVIRTT